MKPTDVVRAVVAAHASQDWGRVVSLCDPASVAQFARREVAQWPRESRVFTVADYQRGDPEMPREVAEYLLGRQQRLQKPELQFKLEFDGIETVEELRAASPDMVLDAWLRGHAPGRNAAVLIEEGEMPESQDPSSAIEAAGLPLPEPLGVLEVGSICYVLCQWGGRHSEGPELERWLDSVPDDEKAYARDMVGRWMPQVAICRRQDDGSWLWVFDPGFLVYQWANVVGVVSRGEQDRDEGSA